uniref:Solute-binding protein family 3/N-terminal domain-containing protein n=1 Tax=Chromera velia CCMP2878 TaxID=1169474 RepID=A0A0G4I1W2_9ALVE|eukprot:Cvel_10239.t1-p1 / transcript=Cvel_10239.t1 / gene=Cvel_10239 / organism=Chromera_velia_CCMP2878 / gene_product=hypothetical protein / transcript_product=hypothetical protein / location=Cvel_scaffold613:42287-48347(-) / protein_length=599 / sequence_SO=supercontig / SO=protein_coding / is_pseudo=false
MQNLFLASALFLHVFYRGDGSSTSPAASCAVRDAIAGYTIDVIKEMASRGGFSYTIVDLGSPVSGQSWEDFIKAAVESDEYDLVGAFYFVTNARIEENWAFTYPYIDSSDMLLAKIPAEVKKDLFDRMLIFVEPFSPFVWLVLMAIVIGAGFIHWYVDLDRRDEAKETWKQFVIRKLNLRKKKYYYMMQAIEALSNPEKRGAGAEQPEGGGADLGTGRSRKSVTLAEQEKEKEDTIAKGIQEMSTKLGWDEEAAIEYMDPLGRPEANIARYPRLGASIFMKVMSLGSLGPKANPSSGAAKTHLFIFSFLIFIVTAAYTANLATFLLKDSDFETAILNVEDLGSSGKPACIGSTNLDIQDPIRRLHPQLGQYTKESYANSEQMLDLVRQGTCGGVIASGPVLNVTTEYTPSVGLTLEAFSGIFLAYAVIAIATVIIAFIRARTRKHTDPLLMKAKRDVSKRLMGVPMRRTLSKRHTLMGREEDSPLNKEDQPGETPADNRHASFQMTPEYEERERDVQEEHGQMLEQQEEEESSLSGSLGKRAAGGGNGSDALSRSGNGSGSAASIPLEVSELEGGSASETGGIRVYSSTLSWGGQRKKE